MARPSMTVPITTKLSPASEDNLQWALGMEADRMINSKIARVDLDKEFSVVRNEMEIGENDPFRVLWKQLAAVSLTGTTMVITRLAPVLTWKA